jgi:predicted CXXCH cytochrome family protein
MHRSGGAWTRGRLHAYTLTRFNAYTLICFQSCIVLATCLATMAQAVERPSSPQTTCVTAECHNTYGTRPHVHGPVGLGDCKSCHESADPEAHTYKLTRQGRDLCEYCHLDQATKKRVHEPLKTGACTQCHDPHSSENPSLIVEKTVARLCERCHETGKGVLFLHGPAAVGECTICHDSHSAERDNLLLDEPTNLCFGCHTTTREELGQFEFVHEPARNDCVGCHDPHGADNMQMVKAGAPELCYSCHADIKHTAETSAHKHSAVTSKDGCLHCHTPHASTVQFILKDAPMALCESCHDKPVSTQDGRPIASFTEQVRDKKSLHGPVAQKDCSGCHATHGSEYFRLLVKDYPPMFYAPFSIDNYALCFSCHPQSLVLTRQTADLTDFRNGDLNLHYVHVNKERRGRTCRSCHATHASDLPKHVRQSVPYGVWELPINYHKTETGGGCQPGCHAPLPYDRQSPATYPTQ